jgi:hypothetical protein
MTTLSRFIILRFSSNSGDCTSGSCGIAIELLRCACTKWFDVEERFLKINLLVVQKSPPNFVPDFELKMTPADGCIS